MSVAEQSVDFAEDARTVVCEQDGTSFLCGSEIPGRACWCDALFDCAWDQLHDRDYESPSDCVCPQCFVTRPTSLSLVRSQ